MIRRSLRAFPALMRVGLAEAFAYRAEFVVWMLTTTMPLIMLALWSAVADEAPFGRFALPDFVAYYLGAFIVRTVSGSWVIWEINQEIRTGTLSTRLLRPVHPFVAYAAEHIAAIPMRAALALPVAAVLLVATSGARVAHDPVQIAMLPLILAGAWLITFLANTIIGSLALFLEQSTAVWEIYMGVFAVLSGYLVPLELMPGWVTTVSSWLPFRYMLGFPVEALVGMTSRAQAVRGLAVQWGFVLFLFWLAGAIWRRGIRRFEAYGA